MKEEDLDEDEDEDNSEGEVVVPQGGELDPVVMSTLPPSMQVCHPQWINSSPHP